MTNPLDRRRFLKRTTTVAAAAAAGGWIAGTPRSAAAIEPIQRNGTPKFKFSLAGYSYRSLLQGADAPLNLFQFLDDCAKMGLEGAEPTSYYFPQPVTGEFLRSLRRHAFRLGLDISGTAVGNDFGHADPQKRQQQIDAVKQWIRHAEVLGAPVIRIFAGHPKPGIAPDEQHRLYVDGMQQCCDFAGQHGIHLALENHGGPTTTADDLLALVRDVDSPWFGVNLDTGNFQSDDVYHDMERTAPYALNVQVKVTLRGPDGKRQPADLKRIATILRSAAYRGYIVLEYEEAGDPRVECPQWIDRLREAFA